MTNRFGSIRRVQFVVGVDDASFEELARAMMKANPNEAIKAFGAAQIG